MSRSDSRQAPPAGYRPQPAPPQNAPNQSAHLQGEYDLAGWTQGLGGAPIPNPKPQQAAAPQGYPPQSAYGSQPTAPQGYGYGQPDTGNYWGTGQQAAPAPQFDPYTPPTTPSRRPTQPAAPYAQPPPASYGNNGYAPPDPALRGAQYDQWAASPTPGAAPAADPRGYDLASYMPPQGRPQPPQQDYGHLTADLATHAPAQSQGNYAEWGHQNGGYQQAPQGYAGQPGYDAGGYAQQGYAQQGYDQQGYADPNAAQQGYEDDGYDYEEPPRGRKWMKVAGALVGAIVLGGGLTFAYQNLLGNSAGGPTPVVKSAEGPSRTKPSEPGGKQFANTDSKLLGRLGDNGASSESDSSGARKVQTLVVGRDGAIQAPAAAPPEPVSVPGVSVPVPGMTLIDVPTPGAPATPAAQKPQPIVVQPPSEPVQVASNEPRPAPVLPKSINNQDAQPPAEPVAEKAKPKPVTKTAAIPENAAPVTAAAASPPVTKPSGLGYVAVLASVPASGTSRITALQQFADLQQRYGGILQNKTPDVTEANLGEKGRYHRLVVGPPGSKDGANSVCSELKTAGYASCWVMAY